MKILSLDLATKTGWAYHDDEGEWFAGLMDFKNQRHEGGGMRYLKFKRWLSHFVDTYAPEAVVYEEVRRHMSTDAAHVHGGLLATLQSLCEARGIPYTGIPVGTIKKRATGKGNAGKQAMVDTARAHWPTLSIVDDNVADALWIGVCGVEMLGVGA